MLVQSNVHLEFHTTVEGDDMAQNAFDWVPTRAYLRDSRIGRFMQRHGIATCAELVERANSDTRWFWSAALEDLGIEWHTSYHTLCDDSGGMPWTKWFLGGRLNIVHHCLDRHAHAGYAQKTALAWEGEDGCIRNITYEGLAHLVERLAAAMTNAGVIRGDTVAMCMNLTIEAVAVMFASLKIGAACVQIGTWHAPAELADTMQRGSPKMLFIHDHSRRGGQDVCLREAAEHVATANASLKIIVVVPRLGVDEYEQEEAGAIYGRRIKSFRSFLALAEENAAQKTLALDAETPSLILFSSGTTGRPKGILHTHGGALLQAAKEVGYAFDCHTDDVFCWVTNFGWMMAPWEIIGAMFFASTLVLVEGSHTHPTPHRLFEIIERNRISILGVTPGHLQKLRFYSERYDWHDLTSIRILGSTGKVLDADLWRWFFSVFGGRRCPIINIFGGTEILGCLGSPLPVMPLKAGTVGMASLGTGADVCDEQGQALRGQAGEVVCRSPIPSMTRGFLGDHEGYLHTYFPGGTNIWRHGDRAIIDEDGLWFHLGRADDLIIRDGVKHDPVRIENALKLFPGPPQILDAAAVGVTNQDGRDRMVCFVVLGGACAQDADVLLRDVRAHVKETYGPFGQPDEVYAVRELPLNPANKVPHKVLQRLYEGKDVEGIALQNPSAIEDIQRALRG